MASPRLRRRMRQDEAAIQSDGERLARRKYRELQRRTAWSSAERGEASGLGLMALAGEAHGQEYHHESNT